MGCNDATAALASRARQRGIESVEVGDAEEAASVVERILATAPLGEEGWERRKDRDVVLVKASNALRLWAVAERLLPTSSLDVDRQ